MVLALIACTNRVTRTGSGLAFGHEFNARRGSGLAFTHELNKSLFTRALSPDQGRVRVQMSDLTLATQMSDLTLATMTLATMAERFSEISCHCDLVDSAGKGVE